MATFEKVTPVTEDEADDIRVTLELDEGEVECEILTIFEANNRDYIALMPLDKKGEGIAFPAVLKRRTCHVSIQPF